MGIEPVRVAGTFSPRPVTGALTEGPDRPGEQPRWVGTTRAREPACPAASVANPAGVASRSGSSAGTPTSGPTSDAARSVLHESRHRYDYGVSRLDRITTNPEICHGKPVIRGLRYPVENLLDLLASGMTIEEIIDDHPDLERDDLLAALEFAALASGMRRSVPLGAE